jgi:hypothetical protein
MPGRFIHRASPATAGTSKKSKRPKR